jgi:hypothetical protein
MRKRHCKRPAGRCQHYFGILSEVLHREIRSEAFVRLPLCCRRVTRKLPENCTDHPGLCIERFSPPKFFSLARCCLCMASPPRVDMSCQSPTLDAVALTSFLCQTPQHISSTTAEARGRTNRGRKSGRASVRSGQTKAVKSFTSPGITCPWGTVSR